MSRPGNRMLASGVTAAVLVVLAGCGGSNPSGAGSPSSSSTTDGRVSGVVTAGPTCPVERADEPCPPRPVSAEIDARTPAGNRVAATHTDADGRYEVRLPRGSFVLSVVTNGLPRCPATQVTVTSAGDVTADITCDTGIR
jgi:hypothetical protein